MSLKPYRGPLPIAISDGWRHDRDSREEKANNSDTEVSSADESDLEKARVIIPLLAARSCHLPGNNLCQDWIQFMRNNHPLFGICFHHRLHPLGIGQRIVNLIGSIAFGLTATNIVFLLHIYYGQSMDDVILRLSLQGGSTTDGDIADIQQLEITYGVITLWTLGGMLHSIFDISLWYISACSCFLPGGLFGRRKRLHNIGSYCVISIVAVLVAITTSVVVLRATFEAKVRAELDSENNDDMYAIQSYNFVLGYLIELLLAYCVHYPLVATIFFSGILSCGFLPFLGGRPAEVREELRKKIKQSSAGNDATDKATLKNNKASIGTDNGPFDRETIDSGMNPVRLVSRSLSCPNGSFESYYDNNSTKK